MCVIRSAPDGEFEPSGKIGDEQRRNACNVLVRRVVIDDDGPEACVRQNSEKDRFDQFIGKGTTGTGTAAGQRVSGHLSDG